MGMVVGKRPRVRTPCVKRPPAPRAVRTPPVAALGRISWSGRRHTHSRMGNHALLFSVVTAAASPLTPWRTIPRDSVTTHRHHPHTTRHTPLQR